MSDKWVKLFEKEIYDFLWRGFVTKHPVKRDIVSLPKVRGGLGFTRLRLKTNSLLLRQCFRMLTANGNSRNQVTSHPASNPEVQMLPTIPISSEHPETLPEQQGISFQS